jgi:phage tail protein X
MIPTDDKLRKQIRAFQGFVKYFPDATAAVALLSKIANEQHNPGEPMHWAKEKSTEELDSLMNHLIDIACKGELSRDSDGILDAVKIAWRGMANLQRLLDKHGLEIAFPEAAKYQQVEGCMADPSPGDEKFWAAIHKAKEANDYHRITGKTIPIGPNFTVEKEESK